MTPIGVKLRRIRNLYVLIVFAPGSRRRVLWQRVTARPAPLPRAGDVFRKLRVTSVESRVERCGDEVRHVSAVYTRALARRRGRRGAEVPSNVVKMPTGDGSTVAEFLRYHVLVRVFDGDPDLWIAQLQARGDGGGDLRFVRWIRSRLRQDPSLILSIRRMVDATPFWRYVARA